MSPAPPHAPSCRTTPTASRVARACRPPPSASLPRARPQVRRKDFWELMAHHVATIGLIVYSLHVK